MFVSQSRSGRVGIGNSSPVNYTGAGARSLVVGSSSSASDPHGITIVGGSSSTSNLAFSDHAGDGGTTDYRGLFQYVHSDDSLRTFVASTERLRILSDGTSVFIGDITYTNNAPTYRGQIILADTGGSEGAAGGIEFHTNSSGGAGYGVRTQAGGSTTPELYTQTRTNSSSWTRITKVNGTGFIISNDTFGATTHLGNQLSTNGTGTSRFTVTNNEAFTYDNYNGSGYYQVDFRWNNSEVGKIQVTSSATAYETSSDYRLKENIADITDGIDIVKQLQPKRYNFIVNADTDVETGFIAHEVEEVLDHVVSGEKDATLRVGDITDADGNLIKQSVREPASLEEGQTWTYVQTVDQYQMLDYARLTPILTAALKEAVAKIEALEARVATLESS